MNLSSASIFVQAGNQVGDFLPRLGGAIALLIIGVILAGLIRRVLVRVLLAADVDVLAERVGVADVLDRIGLGRSLARVIGVAVRVALVIVVILAAVSLLGLQFLSQSLNQGVLLLPKLLVAAALLLAGVVLGGFARARVDRLTFQLDFPVSLGSLAQVIVVAVFAITAAAQIAISTAVLMVLLGILLAAGAATFALAFGLGGREFARAVSAGRHVRSTFKIGEEISVGDQHGRIIAIQGASTVLDAGAGMQVHVPNHLLLESVVTVHSGPAV